MSYDDLLYFDGPNTLEEITRHRDILAGAIAEAAYKAGIYNGKTPISGPHLLMFLSDMVENIKRLEDTLEPENIKADLSSKTNADGLIEFTNAAFDHEKGFFGTFKQFQPPIGFEHLQPNIQGIWVDGEWKKAMAAAQPEYFATPAQGLDYDGSRIISCDAGHNIEFCDVKFLTKIKKTSYKTSADVYISHNEYKFGRANNTIYEIVFLEDGFIKHLTSFTFQEAKECGAITLFPEGRKALDRETGKDAIPWCIDILTVRPMLEHRLIDAYAKKP